jgi:threonyl-tRNA synthetase
MSLEQETEIVKLRERIRHSAAHIMADAVMQLFPDAKIGIGPPTEDGFYYDFEVSRPFTPDDLQSIEKIMADTIANNYVFQREELELKEATEAFSDQPYKLEIIDNLEPKDQISIYRHGAFSDLCRGPHVDSTGDIIAFKLLNIAGAYWRGDEKRTMMQRIYGTAFESKDELSNYVVRLEEAQKRDHRRLGRELDLYMFHPIAPASPFFFPKGALIYNLLTEYVRELYVKYGYKEVITPQIYSTDLWKRSGHYDNYVDNMFMVDIDDREYGVKPMNCPAHALMYSSKLHSYRDLPLRYADFGRLHRYERSGVTHGLTRVRTFSQDDAHIFCTPTQIDSEVENFINMLLESYKHFGFDDIRINLSLRPEKRVGSDEMWDRAENALERVLESISLPFQRSPGEGAFYGPKIDFFVPDALGREWQLGTVQLDFALPERFDLEYISEDGSQQRPVMIHRAMLGAIERFMGVLIEHYGGAFPVWLAPIQVIVIPIADRHIEHAISVKDKLLALDIRADVDSRSERMNAKIRDAQVQKIPFMLILGDREIESDMLSVRLRSGEDAGTQTIDNVSGLIKEYSISGK